MTSRTVSVHQLLGIGLAATLAASLTVGCASQETRPAPGAVVVVPPAERVVTHPGGRYELRGEGTAKSPYYWAWVPTGPPAVATVPALPATPTVVVTAPSQRVVAYPEGRYELAGEGTQRSPYYWVWIPTGAAPPPPPPFPRRAQSP
jgi:hypothetical protein